jgi:hypothetical protein
MAKLNDKDGYHAYGWMINQLHLEGGDLTTFAVIYGFIKGYAGEYIGNTYYLSAWTGWSDKTCRVHLANLVEKGLIVEAQGREGTNPCRRYKLAPGFYDKYSVKITEQDGKNFRVNSVKTSESLGKNFREEKNMEEKTEKNIPPTPQEVTKYASERGFRDPAGFAATFVAYYEAAHWCKKDGSKIRNWRQAVITWEANNKNRVFPKDSSSENKQIGWEQYEKIMQN